MSTCRNCQVAAFALRRLGFKDNISWGKLEGAPNEMIHATHSNAGTHIERKETMAEYERRKRDAVLSKVKEIPPFGQTVREYPLSSLCVFYSNEIAWLTAGRPTRVTAYMAHPVSGPDFHDNVRNATIWLRYLRRLSYSSLCELIGYEYPQKPLILCPWLAAIEEDEIYPGGREGVIADARDTVMMFDEVWLVGNRITDGMRVEASTARVVRDLTSISITAGSELLGAGHMGKKSNGNGRSRSRKG